MNEKKIKNYLIAFLRFTLFIAVIIEIYSQRWLMLFITLITIALTFGPGLFEKKYKIDIPDSFELWIILFIYAALYLGEVQQFYVRFWWWDVLLHFWSAMAFGMIGLSMLFILYEKKKIYAKPIWIVLFAFAFSVSIGAVWEIFEFTIDQTFGTNMQKSGLVDTMFDLIINCIGALITSIAGFIYIKNKKHSYISRMIELFVKQFKREF